MRRPRSRPQTHPHYGKTPSVRGKASSSHENALSILLYNELSSRFEGDSQQQVIACRTRQGEVLESNAQAEAWMGSVVGALECAQALGGRARRGGSAQMYTDP